MVAAIAVVTLNACKKIEIKPDGTAEIKDAVKTERDVKDLLNAAYGPLPGSGFYGGRLQRVSEYLADEADGSRITDTYEKAIFTFNASADGGDISMYKEPYIVIQRANLAMENLALVTSSAATASNYKGQAEFLRAISHFELVKLYAQPYGYTPDNSHLGIVIRTKSSLELGRARNTVKDVYSQIIADLKDAAGLLPSNNGNLPSKWAAEGFLAKVYFQMNKFDSAYFYSNDVISNGTATFDTSAAYITNRFSNPVSKEAVFYLVNETTPYNQIKFGSLRNDANKLLGLGLPLNSSAYNIGVTNSKDVRLAWYSDTTGLYGIKKYMKNDFILPLLHITELKLIRAESAIEQNQNRSVAVDDINDITNRAYRPSMIALTPLNTYFSNLAIKARIRNEHRLEMVYEAGNRLQEIKRIGAKGEASFSHDGAPWNCNGMVLQFPASEYNVNTNFIPNQTGGCL